MPVPDWLPAPQSGANQSDLQTLGLPMMVPMGQEMPPQEDIDWRELFNAFASSNTGRMLLAPLMAIAAGSEVTRDAFEGPFRPGASGSPGVADKIAEIASDLTGTGPLKAAVKGAAPGLGVFGGAGGGFSHVKPREMEAEGALPHEIWRETGAHRGADNIWRTEIDDADAVLDFTKIGDFFKSAQGMRSGQLIDEELVKRATTPLSAVLNHPEVFERYPEIGSIPTSANAGPNTGVYFPKSAMEENDGLYGLMASAENPSELKRIILHELQHAIQEQEGFAVGGNPMGWNVQGFTNELRSAAGQAVPPLEIRREAFVQALKRRGVSEQEAIRLWGQGNPEPYGALVRAVKDRELTGMDIYRGLAGEVEARNVEKRAMPGSWARLQPPWETEDIPRYKQFLTFDDDPLIRPAWPGYLQYLPED